MKKEELILKPNIVNGIIPIFLKNFTDSFLIVLLIGGVSFLLKELGVIKYTNSSIITGLIILLFVMSLFSVLFKILLISNTRYYFYKTHVVSDFQLIKIKRMSVPYNQIVNITVDVSLWDRLCNAGDIIIHTAEDKAPDLTLFYIKNPKKMELSIYKMIHKKN